MQVERPSSVVIETRVDIRKLAAIHQYFTSRGLIITSRSDLLRTVIDVYSGNLLSNTVVKGFDTLTDAYKYLMSQGLPFGQQGTKGRESVIRALQNESLMDTDMGEEIAGENIDESKYNDALKMLEDADAVSEKRTKQAKKG